MGKVFSHYCEDLDPVGVFIPGATGRGDMPFTRMVGMNPTAVGFPNGARITYSSDSLRFSDWISASTRLEADWSYPNTSSRFGNSSAMTSWSARWYYYLDGNPLYNSPQPVIEFLDSGTVTFGIQLQEDIIFQSNVMRKLRFYGPSFSTTYTSYQLPTTTWMRFELQVDNSASPKCTCRVYVGDDLTPVVTFTGSPTSAASTTLRFGDNNTGVLTQPFNIAKVDVWDTYDADGAMPGAIYESVRDKYEWFEWSNEELVPLELEGTWDQSTESVIATTLNEWDTRLVVPKGFSVTSNVAYANNGRAFDIFIPDAPPPDGGYPVYVFFHGGFFIAGSKSLMNQDLIHHLINRGFVVVRANYILSQLGVGGPSPSWPTAARYPEHLIDGKLVLKYLVNNYSEINPDKIIAGGFSAGSWIGMAVGTTVGMSDDGEGRDLRLSGTIGATRGGSGLGDDILPMGIFVYAPLVDLQLAYDRDLSHPNYGFGNVGYGNIRLGMTAFMGIDYTNTPNLDGTSIIEYLAVQDAADRPVPPIGITHGSSDFLLDWTQKEALETAATTHGTDLSVYTAPGIIHEFTDKLFDINDFDRWLERIGGV